MFKLKQTLNAWNSSDFGNVFKREISYLKAEVLPLQQGLSGSSYASPENLSVTILKINSDENSIFVKAGLFYTGVIAGCSCADDPTPVSENNEYCEAVFVIDKATADTTVTLVD
jgi:hypothetical protein